MKAKQLLLAAIHPRLPIEGELPDLDSATEWLKLEAEQRKEIAGKAAKVRWDEKR